MPVLFAAPSQGLKGRHLRLYSQIWRTRTLDVVLLFWVGAGSLFAALRVGTPVGQEGLYQTFETFSCKVKLFASPLTWCGGRAWGCLDT
eukprot:g32266.t1